MNSSLINSLRNIISVVGLKQIITEYFLEKFGSDGILVYPPLIQDINERIPELANRVELVPFMEELDPMTGHVKVGWNLFVMGTNRRFLGHTVHESLRDLQSPQMSKNVLENSLLQESVKEVIDFIIDTMQKYTEDHMSVGPIKFEAPQTYSSKMPVANSYYEKNKSVGKKI